MRPSSVQVTYISSARPPHMAAVLASARWEFSSCPAPSPHCPPPRRAAALARAGAAPSPPTQPSTSADDSYRDCDAQRSALRLVEACVALKVHAAPKGFPPWPAGEQMGSPGGKRSQNHGPVVLEVCPSARIQLGQALGEPSK